MTLTLVRRTIPISSPRDIEPELPRGTHIDAGLLGLCHGPPNQGRDIPVMWIHPTTHQIYRDRWSEGYYEEVPCPLALGKLILKFTQLSPTALTNL